MQDVPNLRRSSGGFDIRANARNMRVWAHDAFVLLAILKPVRLRLHAPEVCLLPDLFRIFEKPKAKRRALRIDDTRSVAMRKRVTHDSPDRRALAWRAVQDCGNG